MNNFKKEENKQAVLNLVKNIQQVIKEEIDLQVSTNEILETLEITKEDLEDNKELALLLKYLNEEFENDNFSELADNIGSLKYRESFFA